MAELAVRQGLEGLDRVRHLGEQRREELQRRLAVLSYISAQFRLDLGSQPLDVSTHPCLAAPCQALGLQSPEGGYTLGLLLKLVIS